MSRGPNSEATTVSHAELAAMPLILPPPPNMTHTALDRAFAAAGLSPNVVMEADVVSNILSSIRAAIGSSVLPKGDLTDLSGSDLAKPIEIDPPLYLTWHRPEVKQSGLLIVLCFALMSYFVHIDQVFA